MRILPKSLTLRFKSEKLSSSRFFRRRYLWCTALAMSIGVMRAAAADDPVPVRAEVGRGPYFVGQGIEFRITVAGGRHPPKIELPTLSNARAWQIGTESRPISRSEIGSVVRQDNAFVTRFRLVPTRPGVLQIPSVPILVENRSVRSRSLSVTVLPIPAAGRPAAFLGGIGQFALQADASASAVRVGQEFELRIKVLGPAAWGMTEPPELLRFDRVPLGLRIRSGPTLAQDEPPERTFTYHLRPTRAGEAVLPPISIASFDPVLSRFMTQVTPGVPIRVVAVSPFDPATIDRESVSSRQNQWIDWTWTASSVSAVALVAAFLSLVVVRVRLRNRRRAAESAARRFAAGLARSLSSDDLPAGNTRLSGLSASSPSIDAQGQLFSAARCVSDHLIRYLELGIERPPGALTPDEASIGVARVSRSADLGAKAGQLMSCSDRVLYGETFPEISASDLLKQARALFEELGKTRSPSESEANAPPSRATG